jgi:catechol 2,3-dioxygenase-like lactoylglutathione lyase family enzyme
MFDHVRLSVRDIGRSERFYDPVMRCLGYARRPRDDDGVAWGAPAARGQIQWFILTPAAPELRDRPHRHLAPGLHHVAFAARSRALVDDAYAVLLGQSAEIIEPPGPYDDDPDCYAVFFRDPDGTKLEVLARGATTGAP